MAWISLKSGMTYVFSHYYAKIKVLIDSYDSFPREKILTLPNLKILIKSGFNKDKITTTIILFRKMLV